MQNKIGNEYRRRVDRLQHAFPAAYRFLQRLEHEGLAHEMWISSSSNAHLYKRDAFLAYLLLDPSETAPPSLELKPQFNQQIHHNAIDRSSLVFPKLLEQMAAKHFGWRDGWIRKIRGIAYEVNLRAPDVFFEQLFEQIGGLDVA
jgi:hypothetical protein